MSSTARSRPSSNLSVLISDAFLQFAVVASSVTAPSLSSSTSTKSSATSSLRTLTGTRATERKSHVEESQDRLTPRTHVRPSPAADGRGSGNRQLGHRSDRPQDRGNSAG